MLFKINNNLNLIFYINRVVIAFLLVYFLVIFNGCALNKMCQPNEECLQSRIKKFYDYVIDGRFDKSWALLSPEERGIRKEYIENARESKLKIVNYKIDSISTKNFNAKVKMTITAVENNIEYTTVNIDCWEFKNDNWYQKTGGRVPDWECK